LSQSTRVTDGRTDRRTELRLPRPRGKNSDTPKPSYCNRSYTMMLPPYVACRSDALVHQ